MTELPNGHKSTFSTETASLLSGDSNASPGAELPKVTTEAALPQIHPKHSHLNSLIHSGIVTHLVHVDAVPDPIYALAQMQRMPEVRSAAVFEDGLIALGCPDVLPDALADIAVPAVATAQPRATGFNGLKRIEDVSSKLEQLVDAMEPDEIILNDQLAIRVIDRLEAVEAKIASAHDGTTEKSIQKLQDQIAALTTQIGNLTQQFSTVDALNGLAPQIEELCKTASNQKLPNQVAALQETIEGFARTLEASQPAQVVLEQMADRIDQIGIAQRTAFKRVETATTKAVSGLEPTLDHLTARIADTENVMIDWGTELRTMGKQVNTIATWTEPLTSTLSSLEEEVVAFARKPAPEIDLTQQKEAFATFAATLNAMQEGVEASTRRTDDSNNRVAAQSNETIATLQSLPSMLGAALQHDSNLNGLKNAVAELQNQFEILPDNSRFKGITEKVESVLSTLLSLKSEQTSAFESVSNRQADLYKLAANLQGVVAQVLAKELDLTPLHDTLQDLKNQMDQADGSQQDQLERLQETLAQLGQHLGVVPRHTAHILPAEPLVPGTSLNTLRMEFAELIAKRMKENDANPQSKVREA